MTLQVAPKRLALVLAAIAVSAGVKAGGGFFAGLWLRGGLLEPNEFGWPAFVPWFVSAVCLVAAVRCWRGGVNGQLLSVLWALTAAAFSNRAWREAELSWLPDPGWLLVIWIPLLVPLGIPGELIKGRAKSTRSTGWRVAVAFLAAPLVLVTVYAGLIGVVVYGSILAAAVASTRWVTQRSSKHEIPVPGVV